MTVEELRKGVATDSLAEYVAFLQQVLEAYPDATVWSYEQQIAFADYEAETNRVTTS